MLRIILSTVICFYLQLTYPQSLVLYDEFNEPQLNTNNWATWPDWGIQYNARNNNQYYFPNDNGQNVIVDNGVLSLVLRYQPGYYNTWHFSNCSPCAATNPNCSPSGGTATNCSAGNNCLCDVPKYYDYTSGQIFSKTKFHYGIFEMKCKIPKDTWPAFWLFGECCEEIDIFEFLGCTEADPTLTIHKCPPGGTCNCSDQEDENCNKMCGKKLSEVCIPILNPSCLLLPADFSEGFNTWKLDWRPDELFIYINDIKIYHCNTNGLDACIYHTLAPSGCFLGLYSC